MNSAVKAGVILAVAVAVFSAIFFAAGLHENPLMSFVFLAVVIILNIGIVIWGLKQTAADNPYGRQLINGVVIGVVAGVLILAASLVLQSFIFPDALQESRDATVSMLENAGLPEAQLDAQIAKLDAMTPFSQARNGGIGTFVTSLLVAAIAAIFLRKK